MNPFLGIPPIGTFPFSGSAIVYYDGGPVSWFNNAPANTPAGMECKNGPRRAFDAIQHQSDWLQPSGFINPCTDPGPVNRPCYANGWTGP